MNVKISFKLSTMPSIVPWDASIGARTNSGAATGNLAVADGGLNSLANREKLCLPAWYEVGTQRRKFCKHCKLFAF